MVRWHFVGSDNTLFLYFNRLEDVKSRVLHWFGTLYLYHFQDQKSIMLTKKNASLLWNQFSVGKVSGWFEIFEGEFSSKRLDLVGHDILFVVRNNHAGYITKIYRVVEFLGEKKREEFVFEWQNKTEEEKEFRPLKLYTRSLFES